MGEASRPQSRFPGGIPAAAQGADLAFYAIADRYLDDSMRAYPSSATVVGHHVHDGRLEDLSAAGLDEKIGLARRYRAELSAIDEGRLSTSARIDHHLGSAAAGTIYACARPISLRTRDSIARAAARSS